jgi:hypothetical protein
VLFASQTWPFTVATILLLFITVTEGLALLFGLSLFHWLDHFVPGLGHAEYGPLDRGLGWLHVGRVPMLALLVVFLAAFALTGFALNMVVHRVVGIWLPEWISIPLAVLAGLPVVRVLGAGIARIVPTDESFAVTLDSLVGRVATILGGTAQKGRPAEAKVVNQHGQTLYVMVEPDGENDAVFRSGASVLLVRQIAGNRFAGIPNPRPDLL